MQTLTDHEKKILELVKKHPEILDNPAEREKIAKANSMTEKTLRNRIADLKRYGLVGEKAQITEINPISESQFVVSSNFLLFANVLLKRWKLLIFNFIIVAIIAIVVSLIIPKTYRATAALLPPQEQSDLGLLSGLSNLPLGGLGLSGTDTESLRLIAILKSRTMLDDVIRKFNLIKFYDVENYGEARGNLSENIVIDTEDEGTILVSVDVQTKWLSSESEDESIKQMVTDMTNYFLVNLDVMNKSLKTEKARFQRVFIEERYKQNIVELKRSEDSLKSFQEDNQMIALTEQTVAAIEAAAEIKAQMIANEVKLEVLEVTLNPDHPDIKILQKEINSLGVKLNDMEAGTDENNLFPGFSEVPSLSVELGRLSREVEIQNTLFTFLIQQYEEAKIQEAKDTPTVQVLDRAVVPDKKYKPKRAILVIFYSFLSIVITSLYIIIKPAFSSLPEKSQTQK